ncbi:winged helix-turn-helix domain-containing protein [Streptomyces sp. TRM66268-LWL]|uniref:Winged helix-turn-helix domain-containing protein n=1 Tax=Streptomyces polyasparticus TaxID=2767826 RepID=A0ABR7SAC7_9ACTN|nr:BTAD domain-containing putative transcriptional regulator [Streptomyces polyasparticus]MBC9712426.1 winged helix-turn-helix domain-containing protein [Streptomyces polyasparticus]
MAHVRYSVLGTTQAHQPDGTPVTLGGARLRGLLTVLALRPGRALPVGQLVDEVWDGDPPADANGALQALVGRLRRSLGTEAVELGPGGYRLVAEADDVDAYRFERLAAEAANALADGDAVKAMALFDEGLALWRGPALADLPDRGAEAARWEARRLEARRGRLAAALALGRAEQILPELAALAEARPLDEPLQVLRLRALRDAGRPAEALAAYEDVREHLADQLGADPGPELRALHAELLSPGVGLPGVERPGSEPPAGPAADPLAATSPAPETPLPQSPAPESRKGNLRARLTSFVGREAELQALRDDLASARLVTLLGPGGAGKTRLSQEAADGLSFRDGVWLAELAPVSADADPEAVPEAVLTALGARETVLYGAGAEELRSVDRSGQDPLVRLVEHCARRELLLVLDNCEHVIGAAADMLAYLLARCPGLTVLATSREPLGVPGESVRPLGPLPEAMALRLLGERGAAARPGFTVDEDRAAAEEICRRLDGQPLAIELAAARLRMLTPRQIADRLDDRFRLLTGGSRTVLPRQQTLRAVVDWSWDLLDEPERAVLRRLSVFARGCDLSAAEAVCGAVPATDGDAACHLHLMVDRRDVLDLLGSLVDKSLVVAVPSANGEMRYRLLETVAEYAAERLDEAGERALAERAHLVHYRELARTTDPLLRTSRQFEAIELIETEYENLRTSLRRAIALRDEHEALCLVHSLCWYWQMRDQRAEAQHWSAAAVQLGPEPFTHPVTPAPDVYERCTDAPPPMSPEVFAEARRGARLIQVATMDHGHDLWTGVAGGDEQDFLSAVVQTYRPGMPQTCRMPGSIWFFARLLNGEPFDVLELSAQQVRACREFGFRWELAGALQMRANILANRSEWSVDAAANADEALAIYTELGDVWGQAEALSARGEAWERQGEFERAVDDYRDAIERAERIGAHTQVMVLKSRLAGGALVELDRGDEAERILRGIIDEADPSLSEAQAFARLYFALHLGRTGRTAEARENLSWLRDQFLSGPIVMFRGMLDGMLGWLDTVDGDYESALGHARSALAQALEPMSQMVMPQLTSNHLAIAAKALAGLGGEEHALLGARLLGVSDAQRPPLHVSPLFERETRAEAEALVRTVLSDEAYERAYAEGGGLSKEEAAALF